MPSGRASLILAVAVMAVSGYAVFAALSWPLKTALFPLVISVPLFILAAVEAGCALRSRREPPPEPAPSTVDPALARRRTVRAWAWIAGFFAATLLFGFLYAVPLFVLLYLKLESRESWPFAIVFTAAVWGFFYGFLDRLLHLPLAAGWLFR